MEYDSAIKKNGEDINVLIYKDAWDMLSEKSKALTVYIREGDGTPLQYSCLENPMDGGAW